MQQRRHLLYFSSSLHNVIHSFLFHFYFLAMAAFDLNLRLENNDLGFDLNVGLKKMKVFSCLLFFHSSSIGSYFFLLFCTSFDLNLPLDEYGAVDLNFLQGNIHNAKHILFPIFRSWRGVACSPKCFLFPIFRTWRGVTCSPKCFFISYIWNMS